MYQALYRKYRPTDFNSVVGQNVIVKTLKNSISNHSFSHAYMFFGPRGTGKTTVSKIFARNINCTNPIDGLACQKCDNCLYSFSKECVDIIEIDAASNNGVDEIRDLKNRISLVPSQLKYKVYIIDEVHMLSIGAFNALLKTLEEPPEHAVFILATTDPQKVPETIISRCQCFSFKRISSDIVKKRLEYVCECENIHIDKNVLNNIAILSEGGMRDALSSLDKLISYCNNDEKISMNSFIEINSIISDSDLIDFLNNIICGNISNVLSSLHDFDLNGKNLLQIVIQLMHYCRNLVVDYYINNIKLDYSIDLLLLFTNFLSEKMFDLKRAENVQIYVEMTLLKFINDNVLKNINENNNSNLSSMNLNSNNDNSILFDNHYTKNNNIVMSDDFKDESPSNIIHHKPKILNIDEIIAVRINNTLANANKNLLLEEQQLFNKLKDYTFDQSFGYIVCSLLDSKIRAVSNDNIIISFEYDSLVDQNLLILDQIIDVYNSITSSNKKIAIISDNKWNVIKNEYINNLKNNIKYEIKEEPKVLLEEFDNNDIIVSSAVDLFGDIVEFE